MTIIELYHSAKLDKTDKRGDYMKNLKVRTKLNMIIALVIILVLGASVVSIRNLNQVKDKAIESMEASTRQSYDQNIKEQVGAVISLLTEINQEYEDGTCRNIYISSFWRYAALHRRFQGQGCEE